MTQNKHVDQSEQRQTLLRLDHSEGSCSHVIKNLWPLYQHDISAFEGIAPNSHGLFANEEKMSTMDESVEGLGIWWQDKESLFPYLITTDGQPAGFNLIAARSRLEGAIDADFVVHEFFMLHAYREKGVAEQAAIAGFNRHRGKWEVATWPNNARAISFWRRVIGRYSTNQFSEVEKDHAWGRRRCFEFDNSALPPEESM